MAKKKEVVVYCKECRWLRDANHCDHPLNQDVIKTWFDSWNSQKQKPSYKNMNNNCEDFSRHRNIFERMWKAISRALHS